MSKKLYVGNLPYSITEAMLRDMFAQAGEVASVAIITDRDTNRPRGFAFVEMADDAGASKAIQTLNGKAMDGRTIVVSEARPQPQRFGGSGGGPGGGGGGGGGGRGGRGGSRGGRGGGGGGGGSRW
jgi:RNA recognition motif-containing protein